MKTLGLPEVARYETRVGDRCLEALRLGGEPLMEQVGERLNAVARHLARIRAGQLTLTDGLRDEIEAAFDPAETLLLGRGL